MFARQLLKAVSLRPSAPISGLVVPQSARSSSTQFNFPDFENLPKQEDEPPKPPPKNRSKHIVPFDLEKMIPGPISMEERFREAPERDYVNFPRPVRKDVGDPVRFLFIPEEWFEFFYKKTGVTGPYVLGINYILYLLSKEVWVIEHEFPYVFSFYGGIAFAYYKFGDKIYDFIYKSNVVLDDNLHAGFDQVKRDTKIMADLLKEEQSRLDVPLMVQDVKKEIVGMLLEADYRGRTLTVYEEVKKRLDYQSQLATIERRIESKHMVQWIIDNVKKSITPQQEKEALKNCFADLKALAATA